MSSKLFAVTPTNFEEHVLRSNSVVVVDFWADWCAPCKLITPKLEALAEQYAGKIKVVAFDCGKYRDEAMGYGVRNIPTLQIYRKGQLAGTTTGAQVLPSLDVMFFSFAPDSQGETHVG